MSLNLFGDSVPFIVLLVNLHAHLEDVDSSSPDITHSVSTELKNFIIFFIDEVFFIQLSPMFSLSDFKF